MSKLAQSAQITKPTDALLPISANSEAPKSSLNLLNEISVESSMEIFADVGQTALDLADLDLKADFKQDALATTDRAVDALSAASPALNLSEDNKALFDDAVKQYKELDKEAFVDIYNETGDVLKILDSNSPNQASSLANLAGSALNLPGVSGFIDSRSELALAKTYLNKAIALGIPDLIDKIALKIKNKKELQKQLVASLPMAVYSGDLDTIEKIMSIIGDGQVLLRVPDATGILLSVYRFPQGVTASDYRHLKQRFFGLLYRIDKRWYLTERNGEDIINLEPFASISTDAEILAMLPIKIGTPDEPAGDITNVNFFINNILAIGTMIGKKYRPTNIDTLARTIFPQLNIW